MRTISRTAIMALAVAGCLVAFMGHPALADGISEPAESDVLEANGTSPDTVLQECYNVPGANADDVRTYRTVQVGQQNVPIRLDEYDPTGTAGGVVVMVHGGGWVGGCRNELDPLAAKVATYGYLVFNIDFRLSCDPEIYTDVPICGFTFSVPPDDVKVAMHWARNHASDYVSGGNDLPLVGIGTSAGGNLVFEVGDVGVAGDTKPEVMAGISGPGVVGYMSNSHAACTDAYIPPGQANVCWIHGGAFMGTGLENPAVDLCLDNWADASPACNVNSESPPPPTFIANSTDELVAYQGAVDFRDALDAESVTRQFCSVSVDDGHLHGTQLLDPDVDCDSPLSGSVFDNMMTFIEDNLPT